LETIRKIAEAAGVSPGWLAFGEGAAPEDIHRLTEAADAMEKAAEALRGELVGSASTLRKVVSTWAIPPKAPAAPVETPEHAALPRIRVTDHTIDIGKIAAGKRTPVGEEAIRLPRDIAPGTELVAEVGGDSMSPTLLVGDRVVLRALGDEGRVPGVGDEHAHEFDRDKLREHVKDGRVYLVGLNGANAYSLKRVELNNRKDGGLDVTIIADNKSAKWPEGGRLETHKTDRIHFAAEFLGLAEE
jgi:hypothetical protein